MDVLTADRLRNATVTIRQGETVTELAFNDAGELIETPEPDIGAIRWLPTNDRADDSAIPVEMHRTRWAALADELSATRDKADRAALTVIETVLSGSDDWITMDIPVKWDAQIKDINGRITTLAVGTTTISPDVTRREVSP